MRTQVKIRKTTLTDFSNVAHILKACHLSGPWFTRTLFRKLLKKNKGLYLVAEMQGKIIGSVFAMEDGGYYGYLYKLAVLPTYRRYGIATKLINSALQVLAKHGIDWTFALVEKTNRASIKTLQSVGFKIRRTHYLIDKT